MSPDLVSPGAALPASVAQRVRALRGEVAEACRALGRRADDITVCAVTKLQPREAVIAAIEAGIDDIGENYVQEARTKYVDLPPVRKHFIGHVQTNKAKRIVEVFDMVQSIDRLDAGRALAAAARSLGKTLDVLVQVNVSPVERFGAEPGEAPGLADALRREGLRVEGVMAIGPNVRDRAAVARSFEEAARVFAQVGGSTLSIGMSGDWREAIACGATMIRIGTAIFGARPPKRRG